MADEPTVSKMMEIAGYEDITFKGADAPVLVGRTVEDAISFQLALGPAGEVFGEAGEQAEAKRGEIEAALAEAIDAQKKEADGDNAYGLRWDAAACVWSIHRSWPRDPAV